MHAHWPHAQARFDRRQMLAGTAGIVAGGALAASNAPLAFADPEHGSRGVVPPPKPIPGGVQVPGGPFIHVFLPGTPGVTLPFSGLQLMGLDVEPSTITDFRGSTAVAILVGRATGSDGKHYNLEADLRFYEGTYVAENGARHEGTFGFIWIDLFDPGSGAQVHDFNAGIRPSGLFWTVALPKDAFNMSGNGRHATVHVEDLPVVESFQIFGPNNVPATVSFRIRWEATGPAMNHGSGKAVPATDPAAFLAQFAPARAEATISGSELGFAFRSDSASSDRGFAELGRERNGVFL